jgi:hypothetical protein
MTVIFLFLSAFGPLGLLFKPSETESGSSRASSERFPDVLPFYERASGELIWSHYDWRKVQAAAVESGSEQGLWLTLDEGFRFLPRGMPSHRQAEPNQPENLHEIVPQLGQLTLDQFELGIEDWQDLSHLQQLRLFECFHVLPPPGKFSDGVAAVTESLGALPSLRQLNLLGSGWIRLGSMPALETLILEAADLRRVISGDDLAVQLPQLQTLVLRLRPGESLSEAEMGILQRLQQLPKLRQLELITGVAGQRGFLNSQITALQDQLPGLTVCHGETGFASIEGVVVIGIVYGMLISQIMVSVVLWWLATIPQAGTLPHFLRTIRGITVGFASLMLLSGFLSAWLMEIRWYFLVCMNLLTVSIPGIMNQLSKSSSPWKGLFVALPWMILGLGPQLFFFLPGTCGPFLLGDIAWFNVGLLLVSAVTFFVALSMQNKPIARLTDYGEPGTVFFGTETQMRANERACVKMQGIIVPSPRLLRGSFSDRLRVGISGITIKQLRGMWFVLPGLCVVYVAFQRLFLPLVLGISGALIVLPMAMRLASWTHRRQRLPVDFLLPAERDDFWRHFQNAVFWDFAIAIPLTFAGWVVVKFFGDSFSQHAAGLLMQLLLHTGVATLLYGLTVLTFAISTKDWRRYLLVMIIWAIASLTLLDTISEWSVPESRYFSKWMLSVFVLAAVAGVLLLVKLPGMLRRLELS